MNFRFQKKFLEKTIEKNSIILERYLGYPLTKEMKESIMIHICAAFVRNLEYLNSIRSIDRMSRKYGNRKISRGARLKIILT